MICLYRPVFKLAKPILPDAKMKGYFAVSALLTNCIWLSACLQVILCNPNELQITVTKSVEDCNVKSQKGNQLAMHYMVRLSDTYYLKLNQNFV